MGTPHTRMITRRQSIQNESISRPFQVLGETLPYDTIQQIRGRLTQVAPNLTRYGLVEEANYFAQVWTYAGDFTEM